MGIFNRLKNIATANTNFRDSKTATNFDDSYENDDDLKKIIEELDSSTSNTYANDSDNNTNIPSEVQRAFTILGMETNSSNEEIRACFKKKIKEFHPDTVMRKDENLQNFAKQKTTEILEAYNIIRNYRKF